MSNQEKATPEVEESKAKPEIEETSVEQGEMTSDNLDAGAKDKLGNKKNVVGRINDEQGPDNSPTTGDVQDDLNQNIEDAKMDALRNAQTEQEEQRRSSSNQR